MSPFRKPMKATTPHPANRQRKRKRQRMSVHDRFLTGPEKSGLETIL
jgi:hypothetical protein